MTLILTLERANLEDVVTVSSYAASMPDVQLNIREGEQYRLKDLLYSLMLESHNDTAVAIAEHVGGSMTNFAKMMTERAAELGCVGTKFTNAHGLHDEEHYTTVYDLYLIFQNALKNETFREICGSTSYTASFQNSSGENITVEWENTMQYFTRNKIPPKDVTVLAGKTGTTTKALSCLALLSENKAGEEFISIILKSQDRGVLYNEMNDLLEEINK